jgi:NhaP-type Na+/H+ or K+/H+ antiporter
MFWMLNTVISVSKVFFSLSTYPTPLTQHPPPRLRASATGVALGAFLCALVPMYVFDYGWDWNYCMLIGSILAATDPVAVVGLLKEVGVGLYVQVVESS